MDRLTLRRRGRGGPPMLALLVMACVVLITLDARTGSDSPVEPLRVAVGTVVGPVESLSATVVRPFAAAADSVRSNHALRRQVATLSAENDRLRSERVTAPFERSRVEQLDALTRTAHDTGYSMVAARVVGLGAAQSFSRTVTIDAGTSAGVRADMTVLNGDGLVGRVVRATASTATVLLIVDRASTVGGRLGSSLEIGSVRGQGSLSGNGRLQLDLVDDSLVPAKGDAVVTWGSPDGVPYVAGIPVGEVTSVFATPRTLARHAVLRPYVDFSALDVVGVVVPRGTTGDRPVIAGGAR